MKSLRLIGAFLMLLGMQSVFAMRSTEEDYKLYETQLLNGDISLEVYLKDISNRLRYPWSLYSNTLQEVLANKDNRYKNLVTQLHALVLQYRKQEMNNVTILEFTNAVLNLLQNSFGQAGMSPTIQELPSSGQLMASERLENLVRELESILYNNIRTNAQILKLPNMMAEMRKLAQSTGFTIPNIKGIEEAYRNFQEKIKQRVTFQKNIPSAIMLLNKYINKQSDTRTWADLKAAQNALTIAQNAGAIGLLSNDQIQTYNRGVGIIQADAQRIFPIGKASEEMATEATTRARTVKLAQPKGGIKVVRQPRNPVVGQTVTRTQPAGAVGRTISVAQPRTTAMAGARTVRLAQPKGGIKVVRQPRGQVVNPQVPQVTLGGAQGVAGASQIEKVRELVNYWFGEGDLSYFFSGDMLNKAKVMQAYNAIEAFRGNTDLTGSQVMQMIALSIADNAQASLDFNKQSMLLAELRSLFGSASSVSQAGLFGPRAAELLELFVTENIQNKLAQFFSNGVVNPFTVQSIYNQLQEMQQEADVSKQYIVDLVENALSLNKSPFISEKMKRELSNAFRNLFFPEQKMTMVSTPNIAQIESLSAIIQTNLQQNLQQFFTGGAVNNAMVTNFVSYLKDLQPTSGMSSDAMVNQIRMAINNSSNPFVSQQMRNELYRKFADALYEMPAQFEQSLLEPLLPEGQATIESEAPSGEGLLRTVRPSSGIRLIREEQ